MQIDCFLISFSRQSDVNSYLYACAMLRLNLNKNDTNHVASLWPVCFVP